MAHKDLSHLTEEQIKDLIKQHSASEDLEFVKPSLKGYSIPSLAPDEDLNDHIVGHLGRRDFVLINPLTSSLDAFKFNQEKALIDKLRTLYSSHDTLPKLIEDTKKKNI
ncbi:hypothetical protein [Rickettsia conorii]|nr:hypothetical protein [Rickettsia conorii]